MGIFDFLSDLSKSGKNDLGLGGLKSLLGTRGAAPMGSRGDEMMSKTSEDSLPGYFDPNTREYVPWYVDLFNGGGLNSSEGLLAAPTAEMPAADAGLLGGGRVQRGAGVRPQVRPSSIDQLNPFGGAGPNIPENPLDAAEFQRFRLQFEDNFKRNGIWGNTEREQAAFQYQKSRGANY